MAVKSGYKRVQITLSNEVLEKLERFCERTGQSKSGFIGYTVAMALDSYEQLVEKTAATLVKER